MGEDADSASQLRRVSYGSGSVHEQAPYNSAILCAALAERPDLLKIALMGYDDRQILRDHKGVDKTLREQSP
jgi:hypothetical protein